MLDHVLNQLESDKLLSAEQAATLKNAEANAPFSVHWELKTLLYLGVVMLNIGLGYLIYQHIDTIGHVVIIALISLLCAACFVYAARTTRPFSLNEVKSPTLYFDYALLLGCLTFLIVEGYLQFQYNIFGTQYALATFIPMLLFFPVAYYFDNRGALSLAIAALGTWLGLKITPLDLLSQNDFSNSSSLTYTGILLGVLLSLIGLISESKNVKKHFAFTYLNFGIHLFFVGSLAALINFNEPVLFVPLIILGLIFWIWYARRTTSFYFLLCAVIYGYAGSTYLIFKALSHANVDATIYFFYFTVSCVGIIALLSNRKNLLKNK